MTHNPRPIAKVAGVAGWPVHHSLSPVLHNFWLKSLGLNGGYTMFAVHPHEAVRAFKSLPRTTISGLNVTAPLKGLAYEAADDVTPDAQKLGVCNCLYVKDGKLIGHNTDMEGFAEPLLRKISHTYLLNNAVAVIGAGGAARAVLGALLALGAPEIILMNRTDQKAQALSERINIPNLYALPWASRHQAVAGVGLVVNASAAGMKGYAPLDLNIKTMPKDAWVYDLVTAPQNTDLLIRARRRGLNTIGGIEMLIAQARPSFKIFFGQLPPETPDVKPLLVKRLGA